MNFILIIRSYPMKAEVKAEWNFEPSFIKSNKIGNRYSSSGSTDYTSLVVSFMLVFQCRSATNGA